jgi:uncharacterized membrane protein (UPF0127 family)
MDNFLQRYISFRNAKFIFVSILVVITFFVFGLNKHKVKNFDNVTIKINDVFVHTLIANTAKSHRDGLSILEKMNSDEAMLFVFEKEDKHSFWMRNMKFPIDIVWLDKNKRVVYIKENAKPSDYPELYTPDKKAMFVIEFVDGFVKENDIDICYQFKWK